MKHEFLNFYQDENLTINFNWNNLMLFLGLPLFIVFAYIYIYMIYIYIYIYHRLGLCFIPLLKLLYSTWSYSVIGNYYATDKTKSIFEKAGKINKSSRIFWGEIHVQIQKFAHKRNINCLTRSHKILKTEGFAK